MLTAYFSTQHVIVLGLAVLRYVFGNNTNKLLLSQQWTGSHREIDHISLQFQITRRQRCVSGKQHFVWHRMSAASLVENPCSCSVCLFFHCTEINNLTYSMGQHYFVVTRLHMNRTILRILAEGQSFCTFHHFFPFFDNESLTFPHGLDSLFMWVILCWQMLRVFQSVNLLVSPMDPHLIMRRTTLHWWLIKPCSFRRHMDYLVSEEATCTWSFNTCIELEWNSCFHSILNCTIAVGGAQTPPWTHSVGIAVKLIKRYALRDNWQELLMFSLRVPDVMWRKMSLQLPISSCPHIVRVDFLHAPVTAWKMFLNVSPPVTSEGVSVKLLVFSHLIKLMGPYGYIITQGSYWKWTKTTFVSSSEFICNTLSAISTSSF